MTVPFPQASRALLRDTLLDAVDDLVRDRGWERTTMAAVAGRAGVSRQTVYNEFRSRPALAEAYVRREIDRLLAAVDDAARRHAEDPRRAVAAAFEAYFALASDEPLIKTMTGGRDTQTLLPLLSDLALAEATPRLQALMTELWPHVQAQDAALLADTVVRLGVSHAVAPRAGTTTAEQITRMLGPFLDRVTGAGA